MERLSIICTYKPAGSPWQAQLLFPCMKVLTQDFADLMSEISDNLPESKMTYLVRVLSNQHSKTSVYGEIKQRKLANADTGEFLIIV